MQRSDTIGALAAALVQVQGQFKAITKDSTNPHFKNNYASLDTITETVRPLLKDAGLAVVQGTTTPHTDELGHLKNLSIETTLIHKSGEWITSTVTLPVGTVPIKVNGEVVGAEPTAQTAGGAITYGRRYGLAALLALTTEEDDDGNRASEKGAPGRAAARPTPKPHPRNGGKATMRYGKSKGTPLVEISDDDLKGAIGWAQKTDANKFADGIREMQGELNRRATVEPLHYSDDFPVALEDTDDDLPF